MRERHGKVKLSEGEAAMADRKLGEIEGSPWEEKASLGGLVGIVEERRQGIRIKERAISKGLDDMMKLDETLSTTFRFGEWVTPCGPLRWDANKSISLPKSLIRKIICYTKTSPLSPQFSYSINLNLKLTLTPTHIHFFPNNYKTGPLHPQHTVNSHRCFTQIHQRQELISMFA